MTLTLRLLTLIGALSILSSCNDLKKADPVDITPTNKSAVYKYTGSEKCAECHADEYDHWSGSHHAAAMQHANDSTVLADFNDATFKSSGVTSVFYKKEGKYFVNTQGPDGKPTEFEVIYTFGVTPLQQYLVSFPKGKLQALRTAWDTEEKKWFDLYPDQEIIPQDWLHWTRGGLNWNSMCAECHTTNLQKNYFTEKDSFNTTYDIMNVSCESCHGPGEKHIEWANLPEKGLDHYLRLTKETPSKELVRACAPCHARKGNITRDFTFEGEMLDDFIPEILIDGVYHPDGQILDEVYVYGSFVQSKMYHNGVKCTDCHNAHTLNLKAEGNNLCLQCHEPRYNSSKHSFHSVGEGEPACVDCHMTGKVYMGNDFRRDHSFRVPRPDQSVMFETPNACTQCHDDQTDNWAAENIVKWYGPDRPRHFSEVLTYGRSRHPQAIGPLQSLINDFSQPDIARATALYYLADIQTNEAYAAMIPALSDSSALVRHYALSGLMQLTEEQRIQFAAPLLKDSIRGVRIEAAEILTDIDTEAIPLEYRTAYTKAQAEYKTSLDVRTDFPMGQFMMGQYYYRKGNFPLAKKSFLRAIEMDTLLHISRENLARIYNQESNNEAAIEQLSTTISLDPENGQAYYSIGLIYAENKKFKEAIEALEKCTSLLPGYERAHYNLGLAYQNVQQPENAEAAFKRGLENIPGSVSIRNALAILYIQQGKKESARPIVDYLIQRHPNEQQFQQLRQAIDQK